MPETALRPLPSSPAGELTAAQRRALHQRGKERRKVTPKALMARLAAVIDAHRRKDDHLLVGTLEDLAGAAWSWALDIRARHDGRWPEPEDIQEDEASGALGS